MKLIHERLISSSWHLPIVSGVLIGTSYIPFPPWAALFCFVPLWLFWLQQTRLFPIIAGGFATAFVFTIIGFNWVTYLLHEFAHLPWPLAAIGMIFFALLAHLFVPLAGFLWFLGQRLFCWRKSLSIAMMAMITVLCEFYSLTLFDWNFGYPWYGWNIPVYQWAEFIGFKGLSTITILLNLVFLSIWQRRETRQGLLILVSVLSVLAALNLGGVWLKQRLPEPDASFTTLLIQASINNSEKLAAELGQGYRSEIFRRYTQLTDQALAINNNQSIDFAVWPETAFPALLGVEFAAEDYPSALSRYLGDRQLALITGAYGYDRARRLPTNSLFVIDKDGKIGPSHYSKTMLLAFGEYIPGEEAFPVIRRWLPPTGQFARGKGPTELLTLKNFKLGAQICYESLFPKFSQSLANLGAQFIVNATNDSWYGAWQEPYQHLYMTLARSVEFRIPVIRATNSGISSVALASGEILEQSPIYRPWYGIYRVPYQTHPTTTFYQNNFYLIPMIIWLTTLLLLGLGLKHGRQKQPSA